MNVLKKDQDKQQRTASLLKIKTTYQVLNFLQ